MQLKRLSALGLSSLALGFLFARWGIPAGWMIGPMLAAMALSLANYAPARLPHWPNIAAQAIIGVAVSAAFTSTTLGVLARNWLVMLIAVVVMLLSSLLGAYLLIRWGGFDPATALLGTLPGGAPGMVAMSDDLGADARYVAVMQFLRVVLIAFSTAFIAHLFFGASPAARPNAVPSSNAASAEMTQVLISVLVAGIGAVVGVRMRVPAGAIAIPALLGAFTGILGLPHGQWPAGLLPAAYLILGAYVGLRFDGAALRSIRRILPAVLANLILLLVSTGVAGALLGWLGGVGVINGYLSAAPGGLDTVSTIALEVGADTPLIFTAGLIRFFTIVLLGPALVRWLLARQMKAQIN